MDYAHIEAVAQVFADTPRLAELEVRTPASGTLRLKRSLAAAEKKPRPAPKPVSANAPPSVATPDTEAVSVYVPTGTVVESVLVGVFRAATKLPVGVGSLVSLGQTLGAVEVMRLSSDVAAPVGGEIVQIFVADGQPVEYGQPLFEIAPVTETQTDEN